MSSMALGMSWLKYQRDYVIRFGEPVPDWIFVYDVKVRVSLICSAIRMGWRLLQQLLVKCRIPDDHMVSCETDVGEMRTTLSSSA